MAPKAKKAAKAKPKAGAKAGVKVDSGTTKGATGVQSSCKRTLGRRDTEEQADRALDDHLPFTPSHELRVRKVDGRSARDYVIETKRELKKQNKSNIQ